MNNVLWAHRTKRTAGLMTINVYGMYGKKKKEQENRWIDEQYFKLELVP